MIQEHKAKFILGMILFIFIIIGYLVYANLKPSIKSANSFEECVKAGDPIMESYPRQCRTQDGKNFTEIIPEKIPDKITYTNASSSLIAVELPFPGAVVGKNFTVIGKARGIWFFEASFPIEVLDKNGKTLAKGIAQAQGEWMTQDFVPYKTEIKIPESYIGPATLVMKKDNPSGLPEKDASISFPITVEY